MTKPTINFQLKSDNLKADNLKANNLKADNLKVDTGLKSVDDIII